MHLRRAPPCRPNQRLVRHRLGAQIHSAHTMKQVLIFLVLFLASEAVATPTPPSKFTSKASLKKAVKAFNKNVAKAIAR